MIEQAKLSELLPQFIEAKKLLYAMFGKKIRYVLLTDNVTDFTTPVKDQDRYDIYLTTMRIVNERNLNILGGALHEAAHVVFSKSFSDPKNTEANFHKLNLVEDIFVNHSMSLKYRGAASLINATYDLEDPMNPNDTWDAMIALNQTLLPLQGINWEYVNTYLHEFVDDIKLWLDKCMNLPTYLDRIPAHKELIDKISEQTGQGNMMNDVFDAISMLLGGGLTHQCSGVIDKPNSMHESMQVAIVNSKLKHEQNMVEAQEEAKAKGFSPVDYINIVLVEPDTPPVNSALQIKFHNIAYKKTLEKSAYDHRMLSGSLSKKKIHNFSLTTHGLIRPMFKRRELGEIANFFILLDGSGSMQDSEHKVKEIVSSLVASLNERYSVIGAIFQDRYLYVSEGGMPKVSFGGGTPALEAVKAAIENMKKLKGAKYLIFISDFEFSYRHPEIPNKIKFIKVSTTPVSHSWQYNCLLDELPNKLGHLIANAK